MTKLNDFLNSIKNKNIHVIGVAGTEGSEVALFLNKHGIENVTLHDFSLPDEFIHNIQTYQYGIPHNQLEDRIDQITFLPYPLHYQESYLQGIDQADLIFAPQSWAIYDQNSPLKNLQDKLISLSELYLKLLPKNIIGVTGSNGKSTTTSMIHHILKECGLNTHLTGNDRRALPILNQIENLNDQDWIVMEISNRQLDQLQISPHFAVLLNISENHLDEYNLSLEKYTQAKSKIFKFQSKGDHCFLNNDDPITSELANQVPSQLHSYSLNIKDNNLIIDDLAIPLGSLQIQGNHNFSNLTVAIQIAKQLKLPNDKIIQAVQSLQGIQDRQENVATVNQITYINDRQGTSVDATIKAVENLPKPLILIFGGENKGMPVEPLATAINQNCNLAIGIESPFVDEISSHLQNLSTVKSMTEAIQLAHQKSAKPGTVVFSPACNYGPYFIKFPDKHSDYLDFKKIVLAL